MDNNIYLINYFTIAEHRGTAVVSGKTKDDASRVLENMLNGVCLFREKAMHFKVLNVKYTQAKTNKRRVFYPIKENLFEKYQHVGGPSLQEVFDSD